MPTDTYIYIYIYVYIYIYIYIITNVHTDFSTWRASDPCHAVPCAKMMNSLGTLYVRGLCSLHQCFGPYRHHKSETSFCSKSAPRYIFVRVIKKTVASAFGRNDVDPQTYVCLHWKLNNTILNRRALRRAGLSQREKEVMQMQWSQLYAVDVSFCHACSRNTG